MHAWYAVCIHVYSCLYKHIHILTLHRCSHSDMFAYFDNKINSQSAGKPLHLLNRCLAWSYSADFDKIHVGSTTFPLKYWISASFKRLCKSPDRSLGPGINWRSRNLDVCGPSENELVQVALRCGPHPNRFSQYRINFGQDTIGFRLCHIRFVHAPNETGSFMRESVKRK